MLFNKDSYSSPNINEPIILHIRIPKGKLLPVKLSIFLDKKYLAKAPNAPPNAIEKTFACNTPLFIKILKNIYT